VGAIAVVLINLSARTSLRVGAAAGLGAATVDGAYALAAVTGGAALARPVRAVAGPLHWAAATVLTILAVRTAALAVRRYRSHVATAGPALGMTTPLRAYTALTGLTALNPLTVVYFGALVLNRQAAGAFTAAQAGIFVLCVFAASASWQLLLVSGGTLLGRLAGSQRGALATALASSALIMLLTFRTLAR
jgi:threonine/homoserine/homoserine lactone efflux protein